MVGIRLRIGDVSGILSDGILDRETVGTVLRVVINPIMMELTVRPFPIPRTFKLIGIPEIVPAAMAAF